MNGSDCWTYIKRRREINRRAAVKSRARFKEHSTTVKKMYYDALSTHTALIYEQKQLLKTKEALDSRWEQHRRLYPRDECQVARRTFHMHSPEGDNDAGVAKRQPTTAVVDLSTRYDDRQQVRSFTASNSYDSLQTAVDTRFSRSNHSALWRSFSDPSETAFSSLSSFADSAAIADSKESWHYDPCFSKQASNLQTSSVSTGEEFSLKRTSADLDETDSVSPEVVPVSPSSTEFGPGAHYVTPDEPSALSVQSSSSYSRFVFLDQDGRGNHFDSDVGTIKGDRWTTDEKFSLENFHQTPQQLVDFFTPSEILDPRLPGEELDSMFNSVWSNVCCTSSFNGVSPTSEYCKYSEFPVVTSTAAVVADFSSSTSTAKNIPAHVQLLVDEV